MTIDNETTPLSAAANPAATGGSRLAGAALAVAAIALAVAGWQWNEGRRHIAGLEQEMARRMAEADAGSKEERGARQALREQLESVHGKLGAIEARVGEFDARADALQTLYQDIARSREEAAVIEVEQAVTLAAQQLQLAANVPSAILALQLAEARLARIERPQAATLKKSLQADLERLAALPVPDMAGLNARLEKLLLAVDKLPPGAHGRPRAGPEPAAETAPQNWWQRTGGEIWRELKGLVRIQRFDREEPALLAPGQEFIFRENLKLRLLNARLALLQRDQATWRGELTVAGDWLGRHFDGDDKAVKAARAELRELAAVTIAADLPDLRETRAALAQLRNGKAAK
jgi:uroporphyrin-III C-methyltransferase